jgi:hypothetical protein
LAGKQDGEGFQVMQLEFELFDCEFVVGEVRLEVFQFLVLLVDLGLEEL